MTKKEIVEKLNKEYPKMLKTIQNKKVSEKVKKKTALEFTKFLEELADNTPNESQFKTKRNSMSEDISSRVKKIVADHLGIDEAKVTEESSFIDDLGADSLDTVELVMAFEEEFGSEISDSEAEKILTVGDAVKFIEGKAN